MSRDALRAVWLRTTFRRRPFVIQTGNQSWSPSPPSPSSHDPFDGRPTDRAQHHQQQPPPPPRSCRRIYPVFLGHSCVYCCETRFTGPSRPDRRRRRRSTRDLCWASSGTDLRATKSLEVSVSNRYYFARTRFRVLAAYGIDGVSGIRPIVGIDAPVSLSIASFGVFRCKLLSVMS